MNPQGQQSSQGGHERKDADVINLAMIAALLLLVIAICLLVCWGLLHALNRARLVQEPPRTHMLEQEAKFPPPQLITQPGKERGEVERAAHTRSQSYGWIDREAGVARIPIARAMQLLVARGLPEVGAGQTRLQLRQARSGTDRSPNEPTNSPTPDATP